jgi:FAD binding domain-containing protein
VVETGVLECVEDGVGEAQCLRSRGTGSQQLVGQAPVGQRHAPDLVSELGQPRPPAAVALRADPGRQVLDQQGEEAVAPATGVMHDRGRPDAEALCHLPDAQGFEPVGRHEVGGRLGDGLSCQDPAYDQPRTVFAARVDRRPALIARVAGPDDIARVIAYARETGSELAVRGGGHSPAGHGVSDGGVVIDLSALRSFALDTVGRTVWAGAGLTAGAYTVAAGRHGLATGFGDTGSVGIGGITLAGGIGFLVRKHGLTVDNVLAAEIVTADGRLRRVDARTEPELFWALRGGGGNLGVVTRLKYRLHPVGTVVGGLLVLPATPEVIAGFIAEAQAAPDELTTIANVMPAPPVPFVPEALHAALSSCRGWSTRAR